MKRRTTLAAAGLLTVFGACMAEKTHAPSGTTTPAAGLIEVSLELPGMD